MGYPDYFVLLSFIDRTKQVWNIKRRQALWTYATVSFFPSSHRPNPQNENSVRVNSSQKELESQLLSQIQNRFRMTTWFSALKLLQRLSSSIYSLRVLFHLWMQTTSWNDVLKALPHTSELIFTPPLFFSLLQKIHDEIPFAQFCRLILTPEKRFVPDEEERKRVAKTNGAIFPSQCHLVSDTPFDIQKYLSGREKRWLLVVLASLYYKSLNNPNSAQCHLESYERERILQHACHLTASLKNENNPFILKASTFVQMEHSFFWQRALQLVVWSGNRELSALVCRKLPSKLWLSALYCWGLNPGILSTKWDVCLHLMSQNKIFPENVPSWTKSHFAFLAERRTSSSTPFQPLTLARVLTEKPIEMIIRHVVSSQKKLLTKYTWSTALTWTMKKFPAFFSVLEDKKTLSFATLIYECWPEYANVIPPKKLMESYWFSALAPAAASLSAISSWSRMLQLLVFHQLHHVPNSRNVYKRMDVDLGQEATKASEKAVKTPSESESLKSAQQSAIACTTLALLHSAVILKKKHLADPSLIPCTSLALIRGCPQHASKWLPELIRCFFPFLIPYQWKFALYFMLNARLPRSVLETSLYTMAETALRQCRGDITIRLVQCLPSIHMNHHRISHDIRIERYEQSTSNIFRLLLGSHKNFCFVGFKAYKFLQEAVDQLFKYFFSHEALTLGWEKALYLVEKIGMAPFMERQAIPRCALLWLCRHVPHASVYFRFLRRLPHSKDRLELIVRRSLRHAKLWESALSLLFSTHLTTQALGRGKERFAFHWIGDLLYDTDLLTDLFRLKSYEISLYACQNFVPHLTMKPFKITKLSQLLLSMIFHATHCRSTPILSRFVLYFSTEFFPLHFAYTCPPHVYQGIQQMIKSRGWSSVPETISGYDKNIDIGQNPEFSPVKLSLRKKTFFPHTEQTLLDGNFSSWKNATQKFLLQLRKIDPYKEKAIFLSIFSKLIQLDGLPPRCCFQALIFCSRLIGSVDEGLLTEVILSAIKLTDLNEIRSCLILTEEFKSLTRDNHILNGIQMILKTLHARFSRIMRPD